MGVWGVPASLPQLIHLVVVSTFSFMPTEDERKRKRKTLTEEEAPFSSVAGGLSSVMHSPPRRSPPIPRTIEERRRDLLGEPLPQFFDAGTLCYSGNSSFFQQPSCSTKDFPDLISKTKKSKITTVTDSRRTAPTSDAASATSTTDFFMQKNSSQGDTNLSEDTSDMSPYRIPKTMAEKTSTASAPSSPAAMHASPPAPIPDLERDIHCASSTSSSPLINRSTRTPEMEEEGMSEDEETLVKRGIEAGRRRMEAKRKGDESTEQEEDQQKGLSEEEKTKLREAKKARVNARIAAGLAALTPSSDVSSGTTTPLAPSETPIPLRVRLEDSVENVTDGKDDSPPKAPASFALNDVTESDSAVGARLSVGSQFCESSPTNNEFHSPSSFTHEQESGSSDTADQGDSTSKIIEDSASTTHKVGSSM